MLLKEERKDERSKSESISYELSVSTRGEMRSNEISEKYKIYKKYYNDIYWDKRLDLISR